jgi:hypothetical protein
MDGSMETAKQNLPTSKNSQDIDEIFAEAERNFAAGSMEYEIGVRHGYAAAKAATMQAAFEKLVVPAETFYQVLRKFVPDIQILQVRVGLDYSSGKPVALVVLAADAKGRHEEVLEYAREIEISFWEKLQLDANFWTIIDEDLDQEAIERDFPLSRPKIG